MRAPCTDQTADVVRVLLGYMYMYITGSVHAIGSIHIQVFTLTRAATCTSLLLNLNKHGCQGKR